MPNLQRPRLLHLQRLATGRCLPCRLTVGRLETLDELSVQFH